MTKGEFVNFSVTVLLLLPLLYLASIIKPAGNANVSNANKPNKVLSEMRN